jgi:hypothetical protein
MPGLARLPLLLPFLLAACGGDSPAPAPASSNGDAGDYLPLAVGNRWSYEVQQTGPGALPTFRRLHDIAATVVVQGQPAFRHFQGGHDTTGWINWNDRKAAGWLERAFDPPLYGTLGTLRYLRLPLRAGDAYDAYHLDHYPMGEDLDGDGVDEAVTMRRSVVVSGPEAITVAAGSFPATLKVTAQGHFEIHYSNSPAMTPITSTVEEWYAPGVGLVKSRGPSPYNLPGITEEAQLRDSRIGAVGTDTTAPTVTGTSVQSGGGPVVCTWTILTITTSEPLDPRSVTAATYTLVAADGAPQSIQNVGAGDDGLALVTSAALTPGSYTLTLEGLADFLGNPLPAWSWTFDAP